MSRRPLSTTSFAILGLLAVHPWATYDLAKLMRRSLHFFWPRAESNLYAEPKRLVHRRPRRGPRGVERRPTAHGVLDHRPRTSGAAGVARDTTSPGAGRVGGPPAVALPKFPAPRTTCSGRSSRSKTTRRGQSTTTPGSPTEYAHGEGLFPDRIHVNALVASLSIQQARAAVHWARSSRGAVEAWETTEQADIEWATETLLRDCARAAERPRSLKQTARAPTPTPRRW